MPADARPTITLDRFKVLALLKDPAFYAALLPLVLANLPAELTSWFEVNRTLLIPIGVVLAGHFGVRIAGTLAAGRAAAAIAPEIARQETVYPTVPTADATAEAAR